MTPPADRTRREEGSLVAGVATGVVLRRALAGDQQAQSALFSALRVVMLEETRRHPLTRRVCARFTPEDVVAEVWLRCFSSGLLAGFEDRGPGSLRRLLSMILDRTLHDMVRRVRSLKRAEPDPPSNASGGDATVMDGHSRATRDPTPSSQARTSELRRLVRATLGRRESRIWRWRHERGLDSAEIARKLATTPEAIRGVLFRSRRKLLDRLDGRARP